MSFEDEYARTAGYKNPLNKFLPVLGLFLVVALAAIAWILSESVHELLIDNFPQMPVEVEFQYFVAVVMFVVMVMTAGLFYAAFAPKSTKPKITEKQLKQEKMEKQAEEARRRKRQKAARAKQAEYRRRKNEENSG